MPNVETWKTDQQLQQEIEDLRRELTEANTLIEIVRTEREKLKDLVTKLEADVKYYKQLAEFKG